MIVKEIDMLQRTPPLPALRAFAALVQLGSVTAAAEALSLTAGAVGHQIRALESFLDIHLIERSGRKLVLTEAGRIYGYQVRQALDDIADATQRVKRPHPTTKNIELRIAVLPSFAQGWLLPRIPSFFRKHPRIRLHWHASMDYVQLDEGRYDCAIRFGHGLWGDAVTRPLMGDQLILVASPELLGSRLPTTLERLLKMPLLHSSENWSAYLSSLPGQTQLLQRPPSRMEFNDSTHLIEAARLGLGIALTRRSIADRWLQDQSLVQAWHHACEHASSYYALVPTARPASPALEDFLSWLQRECLRFARE